MSQETPLVDRDGLLSRKTTAQYNVVRRRFCECIGVPAIDDKSFLPAEYLTDDNMAKFITAVGEGNDYKVRSIWLPLRHD